MKNHMQELWDDTVPAGIPCPQPDPKAVLRRMNTKLDGRMRRRPLKYVAVLSAAVLLLAGTAIAAGQGVLPGFNILGAAFGGDSDEYSLSLVNTEQASVSDDNYTMTVTSSIADNSKAFFTLTIEGKTEEAREFLRGEETEEYSAPPIMLRASWFSNSSGWSSAYNSETDTLEVDASIAMGPGLWKEVSVRFDEMEEGIWLKFPVEIISSVTLDIQADGWGMGSDRCAAGGPVTLKKLELSPATVKMYYQTPDDAQGIPVLYFLWEDGSLTTFGQTGARGSSGNGVLKDGIWSHQNSWKFSHLQDIRQMEAVVFENVAYPLDGGEPYAFDTAGIPRPFALPKGEPLVDNGNAPMPLFALCDGLGIPYEWDEAAGTLSATFRDVTVIFHPVEKDGELWADVRGDLIDSWQVESTYTTENEYADFWLIIP